MFLLAVVAGLWPASPAAAFDISSMSFSIPPVANSGSPFVFSVTVNIPSREYLAIKSVNLYIYRIDNLSNVSQATYDRVNNPVHQIACTGLPLSTDTKIYSAAPAAGGGVAIYATAGDTWRYRQDVPSPVALPSFDAFGPGPASIKYDIIWYVPLQMEWPIGPHQVDIELIKTDHTSIARSLQTYTRTASFWVNPPARPGTNYVPPFIDGAGRFTQNFIANSVGGSAKAIIGQGTRGFVSGQLLSEISITQMTIPPTPPPDTMLVDRAFTFLPDRTTFDRPVTISIRYDPIRLPAGMNEKNLTIAVLNEASGGWDTLTSSVDVVNHVVNGQVDHFSTFGILAALRPSVFSIGNLSVTPAAVDAKKPVTISVNVTNTGDLSGVYNVTLKIDDATVAVKETMVPGKTTQKVTFAASRNVTGTYAVEVNGLAGTFTVRPPPTTVLRPPPPPQPKPDGTPLQTMEPVLPPGPLTPPSTPSPAFDSWHMTGIVAFGMLFLFGVWIIIGSLRRLSS